MKVITTKKNQTLLDIALQEYGDVIGVYWLVEDNYLLGIVDTLKLGQELIIRDTKINSRMSEYLRAHTIATGDNAEGEGIGFWYIGEDFVISTGENAQGEGIGFWYIGEDFVISTGENAQGEGIGFWYIGEDFVIS